MLSSRARLGSRERDALATGDWGLGPGDGAGMGGGWELRPMGGGGGMACGGDCKCCLWRWGT
jgi:hypothetical protein